MASYVLCPVLALLAPILMPPSPNLLVLSALLVLDTLLITDSKMESAQSDNVDIVDVKPQLEQRREKKNADDLNSEASPNETTEYTSFAAQSEGSGGYNNASDINMKGSIAGSRIRI